MAGLPEAAGGVGGKAAEIVLGAPAKEVYERVKTALRAYSGEVPPNHDLERALRAAELTATLVVLDQYRIRFEREHADARAARMPPFVEAARGWAERQVGLCPALAVVPDRTIETQLNEALDGVLAGGRPDEVLAEACRTAWTSLVAGAGLAAPDAIEAWFFGREGEPGWSDLFVAFIREQLKEKPKVQVAFVASRLADVRERLKGLPGMAADLAATRAATEAVKADTGVLLEGQAAIAALVRQQLDMDRLRKAGLDERVVIELAKRLKPDENLSLEQAVAEVLAAVEIAIRVVEEGRRGTNLGEFVDAVLARIAERTKASDFDGGSREADDAFAQWQRDETERRAASVAGAVRILEAGIEQDMLRRDFAGAARRVGQIVDLQHATLEERFEALQRRLNFHFAEGYNRGLAAPIEVSVEITRLAISSAVNREQRGAALNNLGVALKTLGEREGRAARLEQAVEAHRAALKERTRKPLPREWVMTQVNLGNALARLGEMEQGTARLKQSVSAYKAALNEWTPDREPLNWATVQSNLGGTLRRLGERKGSRAYLRKSITAYQAALDQQDPYDVDWFKSQVGLGNALATLGQLEKGTTQLENAVATLRVGQMGLSRELFPFDWAVAQMSLGIALTLLGERESGDARLNEAIIAYQAALEEFTEEAAPHYRRIAQANLKQALALLAERCAA